MSTLQRAVTAPIAPEATPEPSNPGMQFPAEQLPQLPPRIARHPVWTMAGAIAFIVSAVLGGNYAMRPEIDAAKLDSVVEQLGEMRKENKELRETVTDMSHKLNRQLPDLTDRLGRLERQAEAYDRYHDTVHQRFIDINANQRDANQRFKVIERKLQIQ